MSLEEDIKRVLQAERDASIYYQNVGVIIVCLIIIIFFTCVFIGRNQEQKKRLKAK